MGISYDTETNTWCAFYSKRHPITRQSTVLRRIKLKSQAEAKRTERELVLLVEKKITKRTDPEWPVLLDEYFLFKKDNGWGLKTLEDAKLMLTAHTLDHWLKAKVSTISRRMAIDLIQKAVGNKSSGTQQALVKYIRGVFQYAVDSNYILNNPLTRYNIKQGDKIKGVLTSEQVRVLLDRAKELNHQWYYHWAFALYTGMRNGELFALTWDKVNLDTMQILVDSSWNKVAGYKDTKSGHDRIVPIAPNLAIILRELKMATDSHFVLPRCREWEKGEQARALRTFLVGLGLPSVRFHDLRATWATIMLSSGIEPLKVMLVGGWRTLKTMQIYIRKAGVDIRGVTNTLELHDPMAKFGEIIQLRSL